MNPDAATDAAPDVGARLGDYELLHRIGSDDLTTDFYARMKQGTSLPRIVELAVCHAALAHDEAFAARFVDQMRTASRIRHLNLVTPVDVRNEPALFVASDFIDAASVSELTTAALVSGESIAADVSLRIVVDLLSGLHALHSWRDTDGKVPGLVHGDISPRSVLVGAEGTTKLAGQGWFGLRAIAPGAAGASESSRGYRAPELADGSLASAASDTFAAAVLLWELLSGRRLYADGTISPTGNDVTPPSTLVTGLPSKVDAAIARALEADATKRFATPMDFSRALETSGAKIALRSSVGVFVSRLAKEPLSKRREIVRQLRTAASRATAAVSPVAATYTPPTASAPTPPLPAAPGVPMPPASAVVAPTAARAAVPGPRAAPVTASNTRVAEDPPPPASATPPHGTPTAVVAPSPPMPAPASHITPGMVPLPSRPQRGRTLIGAAPPAPMGTPTPAAPTPERTALPLPTPERHPIAAPAPERTVLPLPTPERTALPVPTPERTAVPVPERTAIAAPTPERAALPMPTPVRAAPPAPTPERAPVVAPTPERSPVAGEAARAERPASLSKDDTGEIDIADIVSLSLPPEPAPVEVRPRPTPSAHATQAAEATGKLDIGDLVPLVERAPAQPRVVVEPAATRTVAANEVTEVIVAPAPVAAGSDAGFDFDIADDALDASAAVVTASPVAAPRSNVFERVPAVATVSAASPRYRSIEPTPLDDEPLVPIRRSSAPLWIGIIGVVAAAGLVGAYVWHSQGSAPPTHPVATVSPPPPQSVAAGAANSVDAASAIATAVTDGAVALESARIDAGLSLVPAIDAALAQTTSPVDSTVVAATGDPHVSSASSSAPPPPRDSGAPATAQQPVADAGNAAAASNETAPEPHHHHHHANADSQQSAPANASAHTTSTAHTDSNASHHAHHGEYRPGGL